MRCAAFHGESVRKLSDSGLCLLSLTVVLDLASLDASELSVQAAGASCFTHQGARLSSLPGSACMLVAAQGVQILGACCPPAEDW